METLIISGILDFFSGVFSVVSSGLDMVGDYQKKMGSYFESLGDQVQAVWLTIAGINADEAKTKRTIYLVSGLIIIACIISLVFIHKNNRK
ncbi:MAG: hypothetical protein K9H26_10715 [Prolixibacteraceae bacterium]|nr:hypothetical protein [Prolixibacteraceae bacterium]